MRHALCRAVLVTTFLAAVPAHAQPTDATALSGEWRGTYVCSQGETALVLALRGNAHGIVHGTFVFSPTAENPEVLSGSYPVLGRLTGASLVLRPVDVTAMPGPYVPVGIQATVQGGRIAGWIEGPGCAAMAVARTAAAAPDDPLDGAFGARRWVPVARSETGSMEVDVAQAAPVGSTVRFWMRWHAAADTPDAGLRAGQVLAWEVEYDCPARLLRTWRTLQYGPDGELRDVDASAPYVWQQAEEAVDEPVYRAACLGESLDG